MRLRFPSFLLLALAVAFAGCDSADTDGTGTLRVLLTDAPGDFLSAVVTVESVYLQSEDGDDDAEGSRVILRDDPVTVDLLTLQNEVLDLVDGTAVPEGRYHQLRLVISGGYIEVEKEDGSSAIYASSDDYAAEQNVEATGRLQMPSYASSGLKVVLPNEANEIEDDQNIVLLDFDVSESFGHQAGNSGMWVMHPVVHATDLGFTGGADVSLTLAADAALPSDTLTLADFSAELDKGGDVLSVPFADPDGDGTYTVEFLYLVPGTYPVGIAAPEGVAITTDVTLPLDISVASGDTDAAAVVITSATAD